MAFDANRTWPLILHQINGAQVGRGASSPPPAFSGIRGWENTHHIHIMTLIAMNSATYLVESILDARLFGLTYPQVHSDTIAAVGLQPYGPVGKAEFLGHHR